MSSISKEEELRGGKEAGWKGRSVGKEKEKEVRLTSLAAEARPSPRIRDLQRTA